jgi:hypothetical protein
MQHLIQVTSTQRDHTVNDASEGAIALYYGNNRLTSDQLQALQNHPCGLKSGFLEIAYTIIDCPTKADLNDICTVRDEAIATKIAEYEFNPSRLQLWRNHESRDSVRFHIERNLAFLADSLMLSSTDQGKISRFFNSQSFKYFCLKYSANRNNKEAVAAW